MKLVLALPLLIMAACGKNAAPTQGDLSPMSIEKFSVTGRVAPITPAMDELLAYLHREFGETAGDLDALQAKDLAFFGTLQFADRTEHIWQFPCSSETGCWLRVTEALSGGSTYWSVDAPPGA
jgi:hypothetical protein